MLRAASCRVARTAQNASSSRPSNNRCTTNIRSTTNVSRLVTSKPTLANTRSQVKPTQTKASRSPTFSSSLFSRRSNSNHKSISYRGFASAAQLNNNDLKLGGTSAVYMDDLYNSWSKDPSSVDSSWSSYFSQLTDHLGSPSTPSSSTSSGSSSAGINTDAFTEHMKVISLIRAYQVRGHELADLDPLHINSESQRDLPPPPELKLEHYGFTEADLDRKFFIGTGSLAGFLAKSSDTRTLRDILADLKAAYCGKIGYEYMHISDRAQCNWIRERIEKKPRVFSKDDKMKILDRLLWASKFETFLSTKYGKAEKRFSLEGCETLIPGMKAFIDKGADLGLDYYIVGMPHRGRLNVLANVLRKPLEVIFAEFKGQGNQEFGSGDVKYHLGMSMKRPTLRGKSVTISLVANPSHLEAVNPVVEGKVRAKQFFLGDKDHKKVVSVLLHGDAAFSGQGVVYETMGFTDLHDYTTGGTIHIAVNNQIGFTADPRHTRSSPYCSDLAKAFQAPIFHVNGDDTEAVIHVMELAAEWRQTFGRDVVVDIVCYRRWGHNEGDEPRFTQPIMYKKISSHPPTYDIYTEQLKKEGILTDEEQKKIEEAAKAAMEASFEKSQQKSDKYSQEWLGNAWRDLVPPKQMSLIKSTGVSLNTLKKVATTIGTVPQGFAAHKGVEKVMKGRTDTVHAGKGIDWSTGEALAIGTLLLEGYHVRLSGQDVERGTFSQRHSVIVDQNNENRYIPLNNISKDQAVYSVSNSHLSEFGVVGFEYGYSTENPNFLVMWEAQFGDFSNGAQIIIDQFITSGEKKWMRQSGVTLLLPHGYEGQGPEHSSGRVERYLQASDEDPDVFPEVQEDRTVQVQETNIQVVNCTTPANYYHVLRRQLHRKFRKPLVIMTPKSLLRHPDAVSTIEEFAEGTRFRKVIPDHNKNIAPEKVRKLIFCSGKVYYDLNTARNTNKVNDVAIVRVEQLAPFPFGEILTEAQKYKNANIVWVQEEPKNMGAWTHFAPRLETCLKGPKGDLKDSRRASYVGRGCMAATATGFKKEHERQQLELVKLALQ